VSVSVNRLQEFLKKEELDEDIVQHDRDAGVLLKEKLRGTEN
jgi:hypothetical protein